MERWDSACDELEALERVGSFVLGCIGLALLILLGLSVVVVVARLLWQLVLP